jgi:hypothetical protein
MPGVPAPARPSISITLSPTQIEEVLRAAQDSSVPTVSNLIATALAGSADVARAGAARVDLDIAGQATDRRLSRSLLRGLSILTCFSPDRSERGIVEIARELGMSASTTHRYALTLVELGLLERCPRTRKYRLATEAA